MPETKAFDLAALRSDLKANCPVLTKFFWEDLAKRSVGEKRGRKTKELTDPVWHSIPLEPVEVDLMDMPLLQRLRRVRQLGLAYLVYSGAQHTRFDHSIGCVKAASRIFDQLLAAKEAAGGSPKSEYRKVVRLAALMHDVGHPAFSHVGERVLNRIFDKELNLLFDRLDQHLPMPNAYTPPHSLKPAALTRPRLKKIPAAEIASVLLVLSEEVERLLADYGITNDNIPRIAAMIRGYPWEACGGSETVHDDFMRSIISGELDADKLDYVSRDSLFAGIPVAADVERLINQLTVLKVHEKLGDKTIDHYVLGIKRGGVAAVEMFVMTRAYLHDRLYSHPKIRAAEQRMERLLEQQGNSMEKPGFLELLYNDCGDDAVLDRLMRLNEKNGKTISRVFIKRNLPQRALALVRRYLAGYDNLSARLPITLTKAFEQADSLVPANLDTFNKAIAQIAGAEYPDDVIVDWSKPNPIKEDPALWVAQFHNNAHSKDKPPPPISAHFNVEQLSNAYQDAKLAAWVFAAPQDREKVAAAAALYFAEKLNLVVASEALDHAKIERSIFIDELKAARQRFESNKDVVRIADGLLHVLDDRLFIPAATFKLAFRSLPWRNEDVIQACDRLSQEISGINLPMCYYPDAEAAISALDLVLRFRQGRAGAPNPSWETEATMQKDFKTFVETDEVANSEFTVVEHAQVPLGITDIVLQSKSSNIQLVIELKSKETSLAKIQEDYAAQSMWYSTGGFGRISILLAQYRASDPSTPDADIAVRHNSDASLAVIAVGIPIPKATASKL
ncbi:conserved hypothetical protein [Rhodospirillaceae bacterium LM-1]|nr:conserved hypothetical protein [Rhodospirillaceae bacterium LM-1]